MFENSDLKADVNLHKDVDLAASEADIMDLRANLRGLSNNVEVSEEKSVVKLNSGWRSMAVRYSAAAVILVAFGFSIMLKLQTVNNDELYNQYLMESPSYGTSRSANVDLTFKYGRELLNDKNYEQALILFQQVLNEDISNSAAHFYMGSSLQNLEEFSKAISEYKVVVSNNENTLVDLAEFNLGLCYLMQEDRKQAVGQFKRIANAGGFYQPQAKAILKELRSISKK
jgi:tetratricopeptide (TPR) repeat protein